MVLLVAGGHVDGGGAGPGREVATVGEPGDVTDLDQEPGRSGGADAVQVQQPGAGGLEQGDELFVGLLLALIDPLEIDDQFESDPLAELPDIVFWSDAGEDLAGLGGGQVLLRTACDKLQ